MWQSAGRDLDLRLFGDLVRAELRSGPNLPRIPPARAGLELHYHSDEWSVRLTSTRVSPQTRTAPTELSAPGYTRLSLYADRHWPFAGDGEALLFLRADNLLDETIRNHTSFLKHFSPEAGRGLRMGLRLSY